MLILGVCDRLLWLFSRRAGVRFCCRREWDPLLLGWLWGIRTRQSANGVFGSLGYEVEIWRMGAWARLWGTWERCDGDLYNRRGKRAWRSEQMELGLVVFDLRGTYGIKEVADRGRGWVVVTYIF